MDRKSFLQSIGAFLLPAVSKSITPEVLKSLTLKRSYGLQVYCHRPVNSFQSIKGVRQAVVTMKVSTNIEPITTRIQEDLKTSRTITSDSIDDLLYSPSIEHESEVVSQEELAKSMESLTDNKQFYEIHENVWKKHFSGRWGHILHFRKAGSQTTLCGLAQNIDKEGNYVTDSAKDVICRHWNVVSDQWFYDKTHDSYRCSDCVRAHLKIATNIGIL